MANNSYITKKKIKVTEKVTRIKTVDIINWSKVPSGTYMTAKIGDKPVKGVLYKSNDGNMWICQDVCDGHPAPFKFGFKYSWSFSQRPNKIDYTSDVSDIKFPPKPATLKLPSAPVLLKVGTHDAFVTKDSVQVGCQTISKAQVKAVWDAMNKMK